MEVASLANCRSIGQTFTTYNNEHAGRYPFPETLRPNDDGAVPSFGPMVWSPTGEQHEDSVLYFKDIWRFAHWWPAAVREVAPWPEHFASWLSPGDPRLGDDDSNTPPWGFSPYDVEHGDPSDYGSIYSVSYHYSTAFLLSPAALREGAPADSSFVRPTKASMVSFPSQKVLAFDAERAYLRRSGDGSKWPMLFADGSASLRLRSEARVIANPLKGGNGARFHDTPEGVAGRDF